MSRDKLTAWVRTTVPGLWAALLVWLASIGAPEWLTGLAGAVPNEFLVTVALAGVYALIRWAEPHLPKWARVALLGSPKEPTY